MWARLKNSIILFFLICSPGSYAQKNQPLKNPGHFVLPAGITAKDYLPGTIILKFNSTAGAPSTIQATADSLKRVKIAGAIILSVTQKFKLESTETSALSASAQVNNGLSRIFELRFSGPADLVSVINQLLLQGTIEYAEPDYIYHSFFSPNDPGYSAGNQSYLDLVKAPQAWDLIRNSAGVIIGIVDSGTDLLHEDLAANIYLNTADPVDGVDNDHDGYTDNFQGWDFVGASASAILEDNDPGVKSDTTLHGVHVSGIAGAVSNNGKGVASISFNAKLLIIKCSADNDGNTIYRGFEGIKYAVDHGAQVVNCSWGGPAGGLYGQDIINYALGKGVLVVAAAGNSNSSIPEYPAAYPGVLAVAAVSNTDVKSSYSNFGNYVGISAPGNSILSTLPRNTYGAFSGTSMATAVISSAAALLKSYAPSLSMQQVGERLRATSDNIDAKNAVYTGNLGKGRLNIFRALTETPSSVRYQKITLADKGSGTLPAGDTVTLYFDLKNFLAPVTGLSIHLGSSSAAVTIPVADQTIATLATGETKTLAGPFKVYVKPSAADNTPVQFKLNYLANNGAYTDAESFTLIVSLDYFNIEVNKVSTTFTSNGRIGYSLPNTTNGLGFVYNNENLLYEAGLMIGTSGARLSDNVTTGATSNTDFVKKIRAAKVSSGAAFEATSTFDDSGSPAPLPIYVKHKQTAWSAAPDDKYTLAEYEVFNQGAADLAGVYIGLFTDWDVGQSSNNFTKYDELNRIGYVSAKPAGSKFGAVKLLSTNAAPAYYPISYMIPSDPTFDGIFTRDEMFSTLSSGIKAPGLGENTASGYDVSFTSGYGPLTIPAGGSVKVAFAIIGGDHLADIQASAAAAQVKYDLANPSLAIKDFTLFQNYPNPVTGNTTISFAIPAAGNVSLRLYDLAGKKVHTYLEGPMAAGTHLFTVNATDLVNGLYIYRLNYDHASQALKMLIAR